MNKLHELQIMSPNAVQALNKHKARARRNRIQAILANGLIDEVERQLLEEEEAQLERILLTKEGE